MLGPRAARCVCALATVAMAAATVRADDILDEPPPIQLDPGLSADAADPTSIREIEGFWLPLRATMRHLLHETDTRGGVIRSV